MEPSLNQARPDSTRALTALSVKAMMQGTRFLKVLDRQMPARTQGVNSALWKMTTTKREGKEAKGVCMLHWLQHDSTQERTE